MSGSRLGYRPGAPIPYRPDQQQGQRFGFHPAQYRKAQANDVYRQYQKQVAKDKEETLKKRSERNLDGKLKINSLELVFLTINSRRWFGISQIVSVLFSHRPRSSVVTRMKMLGIEFYCGNYDELRRMKELGGVETHCSRCKLISEQDLVKLLLCFYRFTALPRGKGKISTNGLSAYLDDILCEIAMGRVELGRDFHEDDSGKIDEETWSQISERMLLKNAERVEHYTRVQLPRKKDTFAFDVENSEELVVSGNASRYIPKSDRVVSGTAPTQPILIKEEEDEREHTESAREGREYPTPSKDNNTLEHLSLLLPKLIRAERTKKPPRAIWPRWYPPTGENDDPTTILNSSHESGISLPTIQSLFNRLKSCRGGKKNELARYILEGQRSIMERGVAEGQRGGGEKSDEGKQVKMKRETGGECTVTLANLTFQDIKFGDDDIIQIITRQDLEQQYNQLRNDSARKSSSEQSDTEGKTEGEPKEPPPPKPEPIEYTSEQLEYVQKLKESFDFPYAFPLTKMALKKESHDYEYTMMMRYPHIHMPHYRRNPVLDSQIFKKLMAQKRPVIVKNKTKAPVDSTSSGMDYNARVQNMDYDSAMPDNDSDTGSPTQFGTFKLNPDSRNGTIAKNSVLKPKGSIIKSKLMKSHSDDRVSPTKSSRQDLAPRDETWKRDCVRSEPASAMPGCTQLRTASGSAPAPDETGRDSPFLLSDDSGTMSDGEMTEGTEGRPGHRDRHRKRFRKYSPIRERLGSGGSTDGDEENVKPDHVYRFKFKTVSETQDYPYMFARPTSLLRLVKLDKCNYPVGCRSAPFLFDTRPLSHSTSERGPFVRQYDIEPTSENVWSGVSLWAGDESDNSDTSSSNGGSQSAPELQPQMINGKVAHKPDNLSRRIASAGNSPVRSLESPSKKYKSPTKNASYPSGLDILSSVAYNAEKLRNTPTKKSRKVAEIPPERMLDAIGRRISPIKFQMNQLRRGNKRKTECLSESEESKKDLRNKSWEGDT